MPSPVDKSDYPVLTDQATVCQRLGALINGYNAMGEFLGWFLNEENEISDEALQGIADRMTPVGAILLWPSEILPSDKWLICGGQSYPRADYPTLFARLGTRYGIVEGDVQGTMFRVPDMTDRFPAGSGKAYSLASTGGEATVKLEVTHLPPHSHFFELPRVQYNHDSPVNIPYGDSRVQSPAATTHTTKEVGGYIPHNNVPPYLALRYIIKAL